MPKRRQKIISICRSKRQERRGIKCPGQAYFELGKLPKTKAKPGKTRDCITKAIEVFEECEADVFLKQAKEALASLW